MDSLAFQRFTVLIQEDLKVQSFADEITKATLSPQLFKDTECWSDQDLKPCLEQLAPLFYFAFLTRNRLVGACNSHTKEGGTGLLFKKNIEVKKIDAGEKTCLLYTSPSPRDQRGSRMPSSA